MRALLLTLLCQLLVVFPASAEIIDDPVPPADQVFIDIVAVNGSGCAPSGIALTLSPDSKALSVIYSDYVARVGVGASPVEFRRNCQLSLVIHAPDGYTYGVARAEFRGFASLAAGATALLRTDYNFQGHLAGMRQHPFTGPFEDMWYVVDEPDIDVLIYQPCGQLLNLNLNTELRVAAGTSDPRTTTSLMAMEPGPTYRLFWLRCP
jgi:hypothetical protein